MSASVLLSSAELKALLWLLKYPGYRAPVTDLQPLPKLASAQRDRLYQQLQQQGLVDFSVLATRIGLSATGRTLLELDRSVLPITPDERYILQSCRDRSITPAQISARVPSNLRQSLIAGLARQGLIRITQQKLGEVWLTAAGRSYLRNDCAPQGDQPALSWSLMSTYLQFMRQNHLQSLSPKGAGDSMVQDLSPAPADDATLPCHRR
ncbi:MAG: hypothetical protein ACFBSG_11435 [Leptolyngbyaceae cyanobacterium]